MGDNDFPTVLANGGKSFVDGYIRRKNLYSQSGSDIPALEVEQDFEQELGKPAVETVKVSLVLIPPSRLARPVTVRLSPTVTSEVE